ncbi:MAG: AMP-binding protein [Gaiellales bacterium]
METLSSLRPLARTSRPLDPSACDPIESAGRDELAALQLERLRSSVQHAWDHVPHYRQKWTAAGVHPQELRSLDDLARFPFTTKEDLRRTYPFGMLAVPQEQIVRVHASSGTTGKPTVVGYTRADIDMWAEVCARSLRAAGVTGRDIVHVAFGYGLFTGGLGAHYGAERLGAMVIPVSAGQTPRQVQLIRDFRPTVIMCTPTYMLNIIDQFQREGLDPADTALEIGLYGAEPWTEAMRAEIEAACGLAALDVYGISEVIGPGVASEYADTRDGPTVWEDHFLPEVIDPQTGASVSEGEPGELVFTTITRVGMPMIRYRTGDLTRLLPGTGRAMRRLDRIRGRSDDMLIIRGVNVFPSQVEEYVLRRPELGPHYQLEVFRQGHMDSMTVNVELAPGADAGCRESAAAALAADIKSYIGITVDVEVHASGFVPRSEGKAKRVIDSRPKS